MTQDVDYYRTLLRVLTKNRFGLTEYATLEPPFTDSKFQWEVTKIELFAEYKGGIIFTECRITRHEEKVKPFALAALFKKTVDTIVEYEIEHNPSPTLKW